MNEENSRHLTREKKGVDVYNMDVLRLFIVSYHGDLWKEREILHREVLPDLRAWCENKRIQLMDTDIRWGGFMKVERLLEIKRQIQECYYNGEMPFFINLTSETLGLVPMWGEATETMAQEIHRRLRLTEPEIDILYSSYRESNPNSLFLVRDDYFLEELSSNEKPFFIKRNLLSGGQTQTCRRLIAKYSEPQLLFYHYKDVFLHDDSLKVTVELDKEVFQKVLQFIKARVKKLAPAPPLPQPTFDLYDQVRDAHETFAKSYGAKVCGREAVVKQIEDYIRTGGKDTPLLLLGGAGSGKSSVMAKAAANFSVPRYLDRFLSGGETGPWHLFYHFAGAVPGSTELFMMLKRLLRELRITKDNTMPRDVDSAAQMCCSALSNGTTRPLIVMVDAANQFDLEAASEILSWVPRKLAPHVRCVISMIHDTVQHRRLMVRETTPRELHLPPLDGYARRQIVSETLAQSHQSLSGDQLTRLMCKKGSENPLWLSVAAEELRVLQEPPLYDRYIHNVPENLVDLLESVLSRLEAEQGSLLVATLCLLETSVSGLMETELRKLLGAKQNTVAPSPYEEKEELESSEKDLGRQREREEPLCERRWLEVHRALRPCLRPYGDSREGRLDFYHRAFSKAVRSRYFKVGHENENCEESVDIYKVWHQRLADFFERCDNVDRKAEEYLYHLCEMEDSYRLSQCLCDWAILQKLYHEEYSAKLINYWRKAGGTETMVRCYSEALSELETVEPRDDEVVARRYELLARVYLQAGRYTESLDLADTVKNWEEKELGNRPHRMVDLHSLMSEIYEEKLKLNDFVSPTQLPDLRKTIMYARKSIDIRKTLTGEQHKLKLAMSLMKLAFSLESWNACGGDVSEMSGDEAIREGNQHIDHAIDIFQELGDAGHYAEALMTKGVLAPRGSMEQLKYYNSAMEICRQVYGEESLLSSRLYINIGIVHEDNCDYVKAYEFFKRWADVSLAVLGPDHPKTIRAKGVLREPRYRLVALRIKQHLDRNNQSEDDEAELNESEINQEVENLAETEDGYRSSEEEDEDSGDLSLRRHEDNSSERMSQGQRQQILDASDFMQRILNDIFQQLSDVQDGENSPSNAGDTDLIPNTDSNILLNSDSSLGNDDSENTQPAVIEVPPSRSLLIRSNPMRLIRNEGEETPTTSLAGEEMAAENNTSSISSGELNSPDSNRLGEDDDDDVDDDERVQRERLMRMIDHHHRRLRGVSRTSADLPLSRMSGGAAGASLASTEDGAASSDANRVLDSGPASREGAAAATNPLTGDTESLPRLAPFNFLDSNRIAENDITGPSTVSAERVSNFGIQELCNRLRGIVDLEMERASSSSTPSSADPAPSGLRDRIFNDIRSIDNRLQEISECVDMDNREQDNRDTDES